MYQRTVFFFESRRNDLSFAAPPLFPRGDTFRKASCRDITALRRHTLSRYALEASYRRGFLSLSPPLSCGVRASGSGNWGELFRAFSGELVAVNPLVSPLLVFLLVCSK